MWLDGRADGHTSSPSGRRVSHSTDTNADVETNLAACIHLYPLPSLLLQHSHRPSALPTLAALPAILPVNPEVEYVSVAALAARVFDFLESFIHDASPRASGTDQERAPAEYLVGLFEALGYDTELQPFTVDMETANLLIDPEATKLQNLPMTLSGTGQSSGILVDAGRAFEDDIASGSFDGKIALIPWGVHNF